MWNRATSVARFHNHSPMFLPVHLHDDGYIEPQVADAGSLALGPSCGQPVPVDEAFTGFRVGGEIADARGHQVLKEVRSLRRRDFEVTEPGFDDRSDAVDLIPCDRQAERWLARSESAHSDEDVRSIR